MKEAALLLAGGADIDGMDDRGWMPLHAAAAHGQVSMIDWLLDHGATKNPYSPSTGLPLHLAAHGGHAEAARLLLYRGADIRKPDPEGRSAQDLARKRGHRALADYLDEFLRNDNPPDWSYEYFTQRPDQVNTARYHGHSPLGLAAHLGDPVRVRALLDLGAELSPEAAIVLGQKEFVAEWLTQNPLRVNALSIEGRDQPLLYFAAIMGDVEIAQLLLDRGANVDGAHKSGSTILFHAVEFGRTEMVQFLIEHGADVNKATRWGFTPLHEAAHKGDLPIARTLVAAGADPAARSRDGETVLDAAVTGGNAAFVDWLTQLLGKAPREPAWSPAPTNPGTGPG
jgi:ankyrin repeat protein